MTKLIPNTGDQTVKEEKESGTIEWKFTNNNPFSVTIDMLPFFTDPSAISGDTALDQVTTVSLEHNTCKVNLALAHGTSCTFEEVFGVKDADVGDDKDKKNDHGRWFLSATVFYDFTMSRGGGAFVNVTDCGAKHSDITCQPTPDPPYGWEVVLMTGFAGIAMLGRRIIK